MADPVSHIHIYSFVYAILYLQRLSNHLVNYILLYTFLGKRFKKFAEEVDEYTGYYLGRDGHERCDDPFTSDKFGKFLEKLENEDDEDEITNFSSSF